MYRRGEISVVKDYDFLFIYFFLISVYRCLSLSPPSAQVSINNKKVDLSYSFTESRSIDNCVDNSPCDRRPCLNGGHCMSNAEYEYQCLCKDGFEGSFLWSFFFFFLPLLPPLMDNYLSCSVKTMNSHNIWWELNHLSCHMTPQVSVVR